MQVPHDHPQLAVCLERLRPAASTDGSAEPDRPEPDPGLLQIEADAYAHLAKRMMFLHPECGSIIDTHVDLASLQRLLLARACTERLRTSVRRSNTR